MAVEITKTSETFVGTGISSAYVPGIYANTSSQIKVYVAGVLKTIGGDYTLTGLAVASGVTVTGNFTVGAAVFIERVTPVTQLVNTRNNETILDAVLNDEFDKLTMIAQEQRTALAENRDFFGVVLTGSPVPLGQYPAVRSMIAGFSIRRFYCEAVGSAAIGVIINGVLVSQQAVNNTAASVSFIRSLLANDKISFGVLSGTPSFVWAQIDGGTP